MNDAVLSGLTLGAALGCALVGGVFFAFSSFVMVALARLPPSQGIAAMQSINRVVLTPWFMAPFFGTAVACLVLVVASLVGWGEPGATLRVIGGGLYVVGCIGVTVVRNVPRNDALAAVDPESDAGAARWAGYVPGWTRWNTVRTAACLLASVLLILTLLAG
ncbi:MAG: anthrone oxygenase family protein [Thermomicrobiales bacterium]